ncbi:MAG: glycoside hydrolase family 5 protein [Thermoguttaceae bacterium]|nr:glycoside hydrolase family 5 protein [Thermoguttaceae bacterium]MDW8037656.1 cellulase family glycosylhydrolase [Thermoguttaceae bacterium]
MGRRKGTKAIVFSSFLLLGIVGERLEAEEAAKTVPAQQFSQIQPPVQPSSPPQQPSQSQSGQPSAQSVPGQRPAVGTVLLKTDFSQKEGLAEWTGLDASKARWVQEEPSGGCLLVELSAAEGRKSWYVRRALPVEQIRGTKLGVQCRIRADRVAQPPQTWNGVKCMVHTVSPTGPRWHHPSQLWGTFDWREVGFVAEIPLDVQEAWLILGLENTHGRAWFDDLRVRVVGHRRRTPPKQPDTNQSTKPAPGGPFLAVTPGLAPGIRLRGAMISPQVTEEDLRVLGGQWKANHVRWQLLWGGFPHGPADRANVAEYEAWLESALKHLDHLLPVCRELGIKVCIDMHTPPGGRDPDGVYRMFRQKEFQDAFMGLWEKMARRYRDQPAVWGYDLVNEPTEALTPEGLLDWQQLAERTARRIRQIDPVHAIIIEPTPWGSPEGLDWLEPVDVPGVVYSVHMYIPFQFTHQGIHGNPAGVAYPGFVAGRHWDKQALREALQPVIQFQKDYQVPIYIGEFSAIRWAPGKSAYNYLRDVIEIFEEYGWHWAYHAFREWDGWSVEHGPDRNDRKPILRPTDRQLLLRSWFEKNKPALP